MQHHRVLFIDAYDSFSNSIVALLRAELSVAVECIKIDDARFVLNDEAFFAYLDGFDAVVAGPGPGHPANLQDVGLIGRLWHLPEKHLLPVLGICLGFQSLCLAFGAKVERLREPRHGIMTIVDHCNQDIYAGTAKIVATQYHSLHVTLGQARLIDDWEASSLWQKSEACVDLLPLSWTSMSVPNGPTLMGVRHKHKPYWGVQYHPESICTNKEGQRLIRNWWAKAREWHAGRSSSFSPVCDNASTQARCSEGKSTSAELASVQWSAIRRITSLDVASVVEILRDKALCEQPLLLESGTRNGKPVNPETGRFSIIGLPAATATQYRYSTVSGVMETVTGNDSVDTQVASIDEAFSLLDKAMQEQKASNGPPGVPFWGGLVGFVSYEAGLRTIDVSTVGAKAGHPDLWFVMVDRSVVVDHVEGMIYVQTIRSQDKKWLDATHSILERHFNAPSTVTEAPCQKLIAELTDGPERNAYCHKVLDCQAKLRAGESYELCLTDQSILRTSAEPWSMYQQLRNRNPAPFSAFLRLEANNTPGISIVGSSPERFLSWSRNGKCQFRPIKGTVKKGPGVTRAKAEELLASPKERAENLMIVDLIRHDLAGVPGIHQVQVPKLMSVEEYETVFQLVSVIEGTVEDGGSGSAALLASLPPGSMTGAPKKRSCELLSEIEGGKPRGLYSGVLGYFDVGGGGDFSVVIRTAFKWDDEGDDWHVGAGGAITALSEPQAEWEEMLTKRESVLTALL